MEVDFCLRCIDKAIKRYGVPKIFNTDQGVQYTSHVCIDKLNQRNHDKHGW